MPTTTFHCQPTWLPTSADPSGETAESRTAFYMARELVSVLGEIINTIDGREVERAITPDAVWADFVPMSAVAINAAEILIVINPPEIAGSFGERKERREQIAVAVRDHLQGWMLAECDHFHTPILEIEVIPVEASGFDLNRRLETINSW